MQTDTTPAWSETGDTTLAYTGAAIFNNDAHGLSIYKEQVRCHTAAGATVWTDATINDTYTVNGGRCAGSHTANVAAAYYALNVASNNLTHAIRKYTTGSATADWEWTLTGFPGGATDPGLGFGCTNAGVIIHSENKTGSQTIRGFTTSSTPDWTVTQSNATLVDFSVAKSGERVMVSTAAAATIRDAATGTALMNLPLTGSAFRAAAALSRNGVYAVQLSSPFPWHRADVYRVDGVAPVLVGQWQWANYWGIEGLGKRCVAISDDGTRVAVASTIDGWGPTSTPITGVRVQSFDGASGAQQLDAIYTAPRTTFGDAPQPAAVRVNTTGRRIAVATRGDGAGRTAEVMVFTEGYGQPAIYSRAMYSVSPDGADLSADGEHLFVAQNGYSTGAGGAAFTDSGVAWFDQTWAARR